MLPAVSIRPDGPGHRGLSAPGLPARGPCRPAPPDSGIFPRFRFPPRSEAYPGRFHPRHSGSPWCRIPPAAGALPGSPPGPPSGSGVPPPESPFPPAPATGPAPADLRYVVLPDDTHKLRRIHVPHSYVKKRGTDGRLPLAFSAMHVRASIDRLRRKAAPRKRRPGPAIPLPPGRQRPGHPPVAGGCCPPSHRDSG